jgi:hypothetical protein
MEDISTTEQEKQENLSDTLPSANCYINALQGKPYKLPSQPKPKRGGQPAAKRITPAKKVKFLKRLAETCHVQKSAKEIGIPYQTLYWHKNHDPEFNEAWELAVAEAIDALEGSVYNRATNGVKKPVFYQGVQCGTTTEYSDTLAALLLKGHKPERYGDKRAVELSGPNGGPVQIDQVKHKMLDILGVTIDQLED